MEILEIIIKYIKLANLEKKSRNLVGSNIKQNLLFLLLRNIFCEHAMYEKINVTNMILFASLIIHMNFKLNKFYCDCVWREIFRYRLDQERADEEEL